MFDIRINEVRTLDPSLVTEMRNNENLPLKFSNMQFFFMCKSTEEVVLASKASTSARYLEQGTWDKYQPTQGNGKGILRNSIIAHQWKKTDDGAGSSDFTMLVNTKFEVIHWGKILCSAGLVILLGCCSSLLASCIEKSWCNGLAKDGVQSSQLTKENDNVLSQGKGG